MNVVRFSTDRSSIRLPWFYFERDFDRARQGPVWSFEVNGLTQLTAEPYNVRFAVHPGVRQVAHSWDGEIFRTHDAGAGFFDIRGHAVRNCMLSCYWHAHAGGNEPPVAEVLLVPAGHGFPKDGGSLAPVTTYLRNTLIQDVEILRDWKGFRQALAEPGIELAELRDMVREIAAWARRRQVTDPNDVHLGAIHSEEDKFDFQDAAAAAVLFARMHRWTADAQWLVRARAAKEYVYKGQDRNVSEPGRLGAFPAMRSFETPDFCRLSYPLPAAQGVTTCIIANLLVKLFEEGIEPEPRDLDVLWRLGDWIVRSETYPGVFPHHEGDERGRDGHGDCQNSNALAAGALLRISRFLARHGRDVPVCWHDAAERAVRRVLSGQEAIGVWPYMFATFGRGQRYSEKSVPDHGMLLYHLLLAVEDEPYRRDPAVLAALRRAACWYLCVCRHGPGTGDVDLASATGPAGLCFSSFTWCRFMCAASLFRIAHLIDEPRPWRNLALCLMAHVRRRLWNHSDPERAPVVASCVPALRRVTWIQAAEWDAVLLLELIDRLEDGGQ